MNEKAKNWREYLETILVACFLAMIVRTFVFTGYKVPTSSMAPTLLPGDLIFSYRLPYGLKIPFSNLKIMVKSPTRGEVVVFTYPEQPRVHYVKRVIGLPGDHIQIKSGQVYVNEQKLVYEKVSDNDVLQTIGDSFTILKETDGASSRQIIVKTGEPSRSFGPIVVPPNEVFLLGDNRDTSDDSRYWGTVPFNKIESRVSIIWLSLDWQNRVAGQFMPSVRWGRVMRPLR